MNNRLPLSHESKASFDPTGGHKRDEAMANLPDIQVWMEYAKGSSHNRDVALVELLYRHNPMLAKIAWRFTLRYTRLVEFEDFLQHARLGAIISYNRFNPGKAQKNCTKLTTFVHRTVENALLSAVDTDAPIHCPTQRRGMRAYLAGRYDSLPEKKRRFETEHGLDTPEKIAAARATFKLLQVQLLSLDTTYLWSVQKEMSGYWEDVLASGDFVSEEQLVAHADLEMAREFLSSRHQMVFDLVFGQQYTTQEAADIMGLTEGQVRGDLRTIRQLIRTRDEARGICEEG